MNPRIVAISGPLKGSVFPITEAGLIIGRKYPENDVTLEHDDMVSRRHCRLQLRGGRVLVSDMDSRNGTFVNGSAVLEKVLEHGDRLKVGFSTFIYFDNEEAADSLPVFTEEERDRTRTLTTFRLDREQAEAAASDKAILRAILGITSSINAIRNSDALQARLLELIFEVLPPRRAAILLVGHKPEDFVSGTYRERDVPGDARFNVSPTITRQALREGVAVLSKDFNPVLCIPLSVFETKLGVIYLEAESPARFDHEHVQLLTAIAGIAAVASEHARYVEWLEGENERLKEEAGVEHGMVGESPKIAAVYNFIGKAAPSDARVLILGESGTGKELVARAIHRNGRRSNRPFVAVNCVAIVESLQQSEFFGHEKGAFTSAVVQRKGKIEMADGGTLFLDEAGELSLQMQVALLRVLEEGVFERVGGNRPIPVDVRIIAATNRNLEEAIKEGRFREDLYYRLQVLSIRMPSLSQRPEDIPHLASYFLKRFARSRTCWDSLPKPTGSCFPIIGPEMSANCETPSNELS
jgi:pSer/pThr/pTyr-binding forkhead associated (FHA) protein